MSLKVFSVCSACFILMWIELYGLCANFSITLCCRFSNGYYSGMRNSTNIRQFDGELYFGRHNETALNTEKLWNGKVRDSFVLVHGREKKTTKISTYLSNYRTKLRNTLVSFIALLMITICCVLSVIAFFSLSPGLVGISNRICPLSTVSLFAA